MPTEEQHAQLIKDGWRLISVLPPTNSHVYVRGSIRVVVDERFTSISERQRPPTSEAIKIAGDSFPFALEPVNTSARATYFRTVAC